jgi:hypothetical protein
VFSFLWVSCVFISSLSLFPYSLVSPSILLRLPLPLPPPYLDDDAVFERVGHLVPCEEDARVSQQLVSQDVAKRVVLLLHLEGPSIGHLRVLLERDLGRPCLEQEELVRLDAIHHSTQKERGEREKERERCLGRERREGERERERTNGERKKRNEHMLMDPYYLCENCGFFKIMVHIIWGSRLAGFVKIFKNASLQIDFF